MDFSSFTRLFAKQSAAAAYRPNKYTDLKNSGVDALEPVPSPDASIVSKSAGVAILPIKDAFARAEFLPLIERAAKAAALDDRPFLLSKSRFSNGLLIAFAPGSTGELVLSRSGGAPGISSDFNLVVVGEGSRATFVDQDLRKNSFADSTEFFLSKGAALNYAGVFSNATDSRTLAQRRFFLSEQSSLVSLTAGFEAGVAKLDSKVVLEGRGAHSRDHVVCFASGESHFDYACDITHSAPETKASALMRSVIRDSARTVLWGNIKINKGASGADSYLSQNALLLNPGARADSVPTLEIEESDVRATHSSAVSHADEASLYYLGSRGLAKPVAKRVLAESFLDYVVDKTANPVAVELVGREIGRKWGGG